MLPLCLVYIYGVTDTQLWLPAKWLHQLHPLWRPRPRENGGFDEGGLGRSFTTTTTTENHICHSCLIDGKCFKLAVDDDTTCDGHSQTVNRVVSFPFNVMGLDLCLHANVATIDSPSHGKFKSGLQ